MRLIGADAELSGQPWGVVGAAGPYQKNREEGARKISNKKRIVSISPHHGEKLLRAYGGCLGAKCRRRTWDTAKSLGEPCTGDDPGMSEWGNP